MDELRRRVRSIFTHGPNKTINMLNLRPCDASQSRAYYNSDTEHELLGVNNLKRNITQIRTEYNNMISAERLQPTKPLHKVISTPRGCWKQYAIMEEGVWNPQLCALAPRTTKLLRKLPFLCESLFGQAYFSVLDAGTAIMPHRGVTNLKLRVQLPLHAPGEDRTVMVVDGQSLSYKEGVPLVFDDSLVHSVTTDPDNTHPRVVLLVDVWHPSLTPTMIQFLKKTFSVNASPPQKNHFREWLADTAVPSVCVLVVVVAVMLGWWVLAQ